MTWRLSGLIAHWPNAITESNQVTETANQVVEIANR
jgi:hypothetical protein